MIVEMAPRVQVASTTMSLEGPLRGAGIDVLVRGRVSLRLAERRYTEDERRAFGEARDVPFAAREAVIKAVGGAGVLGAPLRDMPVAWEQGRLVFQPGPRYRAIMDERGVASMRLVHVAADDGHVIVAGLALGSGPGVSARVAWALVPLDDADASLLTPDEIAFAATRPTPRASIATRHAMRLAARALGLPDDVRVEGGGDEPPRLLGAPGAHLSLGHEDELAVALIAIQGLRASAEFFDGTPLPSGAELARLR